jgi:hypothetical protein
MFSTFGAVNLLVQFYAFWDLGIVKEYIFNEF